MTSRTAVSAPAVRPESAVVTGSDRATLERWIRSGTTPQRTVLRSRIILLLSDGLTAREVARRLEVSRHTVDLWRKRYLDEGIETLTRDRPGRGRKRARPKTQ
jgi:DNA-binding NarL/FixJ family response regulator